MDTNQQAQPVVEDVQPVAMPTTEQQSSETPVPESVPQKEEAPVQESQGLPDGASERTTREFEKLRADLREERARRESYERSMQTLQTFAPQRPVVEPPKPQPLYDQTTGLLNEHALTEMQSQSWQASERAKKAEEELRQYRASQDQKEADLQRREAYASHPELDPNGKSHNKEFSMQTRALILDNMTNPQDYDNRQLTYKEAADLVKGRFKPMIDQAQKQGAVQALEKITPKEQAGLEVTGTPTGKSELNTDEFERLRRQTRSKGEDSDQAIIARMNAIK